MKTQTPLGFLGYFFGGKFNDGSKKGEARSCKEGEQSGDVEYEAQVLPTDQDQYQVLHADAEADQEDAGKSV